MRRFEARTFFSLSKQSLRFEEATRTHSIRSWKRQKHTMNKRTAKAKICKMGAIFFCCRTHYGKPHLYREPGLTTEAHFLTAHGFPRESSRQKALDTISTAKGVVCRELALRPTTHVCSEQKLLLAKQGSSATVTTLCVVRLTPGSQHSFKVCGDPWIWLTT